MTSHAESALIIYGETDIKFVRREDDPMRSDTVSLYIFRVRVGENGPVIAEKCYANLEDIASSEFVTRYKIAFQGTVNTYEDAREEFCNTFATTMKRLLTGIPV